MADICNQNSDQVLPVMSVYRMLEFLEAEHLAHKLQSNGKYLACSHIACEHVHEIPQFLICANCQAVKEISISKKIFEELKKQVAQANYTMIDSQIELQCLCADCSQ